MDNESTVIKGKTVKKKEDASVSYCKLYRYSTPFDTLLIWVGSICSVICGITVPYATVLSGDFIGVIADYTASIGQNLTAEEEVVKTQSFLYETDNFAVNTFEATAVIIICTYVATICFSYSSSRQTHKIRKLLLGTILDHEISWHDLNHTGSFAKMFNDDILSIEKGIGENVGLLIYIKITYLVCVFWAQMRGMKFALVCMSLFAVKFIAALILGWYIKKVLKPKKVTYLSAGIVASMVFRRIKAVIASGAEERSSSKYDEKIEEVRKTKNKEFYFNGFKLCLSRVVPYICYAVALWYGVSLAIEDRSLPAEMRVYTAGNIVAIYFLLLLANWHFGAGGVYLLSFKNARVAAKKVFEIVDSDPIMLKHNEVGIRPNFKSDIVFKNVNFSFPAEPQEQVLNDITIEFRFGEIISLVGLSESGKLAMIKLLQRFYDPTSGSISIDGVDLKITALNFWRDNTAVVSKVPSLFPTSIANNIRYGKPVASMDDIVKAAIKAKAHKFICDLPCGYETVIGDDDAQLSEAQKLKIALARALIKEPHLLILDEVTSLLEPAEELEVQSAFDGIGENFTKIIISHNVSTLSNANRIIVFEEGTVIEEGSHQKLVEAKGTYCNMIDSGKILKPPNENENHTFAEPNELASQLYKEDEVDDIVFKEENIPAEFNFYTNLLLKLLRFNRPEWLQTTIGCIASLMMGAVPVLYGLIMGSVLGAFAKTDIIDLRNIANMNSLDFLYLGVASGIALFIQTIAFGYVGQKLYCRLKTNLFATMLKQEIDWFDRKENSTLALSIRLAVDPRLVQLTGILGLCLTMVTISTLFLSIATSLYLEWRLTLIMAIFYPMIVLFTFYHKKYAVFETQLARELSKETAKVAIDATDNILTVKALRCENQLYESYLKQIGYYKSIRLKRAHVRGVLLGCAQSFQFCAHVGGMFYCGKMVSRGELDLTTLFKVLQVMVVSGWSLGITFSLYPKMHMGVTAASRIFALFERVPKTKSDSNSNNNDSAETKDQIIPQNNISTTVDTHNIQVE